MHRFTHYYFFLFFIYSITHIHGLGIAEEPQEPIAPIDPEFSNNSCIIVADFAPVDCNLTAPDAFEPAADPDDPCPGCDPEDILASLGIQANFSLLDEAIALCPFDPVLIEFTGTIYAPTSMIYNGTKNLILRGISQFENITVPGDIITVDVLKNVTVGNITMEQIVPMNMSGPPTFIINELRATIVGLRDWQFLAQNISVTFENFDSDGCNTTRSIFVTEVKPDRCVPCPHPTCNGTFINWTFVHGRELENGTFIPGVDVNGTFVPGIFFNDTFIPGTFIFIDLGFITLPIFIPFVNITGIPGVVNGTFDISLIDPCCIPPEIMDEPPLLEDRLGCNVGPGDIEPEFLDSTQRDPCFFLRDVRMKAPTGTGTLQPEELLGCELSEDDIEPLFLDSLERDPCFFLRDLRKQIEDDRNCTGDELFLPQILSPCLRNQNLTITNVEIRNYHGDFVVCQYACDEPVTLNVTSSDFKNIRGHAIHSGGLFQYQLVGNTFCPCGGQTSSCVFGKHCFVSRGGSSVWVDNRHCVIEDLLPVLCEYDLGPLFKCVNGEMFCLDQTQTILNDCQMVEVSPGMSVFDSDCAVYVPCLCGGMDVNVTFSNNNTEEITIFVEPFEIEVNTFLPGLGFVETLTLECPVELQNVTFNITKIVPFDIFFFNTISNMTEFLITIFIPVVVEEDIELLQPTGPLECPCPEGFDPALNGSLGPVGDFFDTCFWELPGGDFCEDGTVICLVEGGELGSGEPPPTPIDFCDPVTLTALVMCDVTTCIGGMLVYEDVMHPCNLTSGTCAAFGLLDIPCSCIDGEIDIVCDVITCVGGMITYEGNMFPCNLTDCAANSNMITVNCTTSFPLPPPGPCSCLPILEIGNMTILLPPIPPCNLTADPNCTEPVGSPIDTGDPTLELFCRVDGTIACDCAGPQAIQALVDYPIIDGSTAFHFDNLPEDVGNYIARGNVAQQLPVGGRFERTLFDTIARTTSKVPHFFWDKGVLHELARTSMLITGTVNDWVDGHDDQWNKRTCDDLCHQFRPRQLVEACVVDSRYNAETELFGDLRFNIIQDAIDDCDFDAVVIHKAENVYSEELSIKRKNFLLISYDNAVIIGRGHRIRNDNITFRGLVLVHPATDRQSIINPDDDDSSVFNTPPDRFAALNNQFFGSGVNEAGAIVGVFGNFFLARYNLFHHFITLAVDVTVETVDITLNTFRQVSGRSFRGRDMLKYDFDENLFEESFGIESASAVDMVSLECRGDRGVVDPKSLPGFLLGFFDDDDDDDSLEFEQPDLKTDMGCNVAFDPSRLCSMRGNRQIVSNQVPDQDTVVYNFIGGNITTDRVQHNTASHGEIGVKVEHIDAMQFAQRDTLYRENAGIRTQDTRVDGDGADFLFISPGSLKEQSCSFPDCRVGGWPSMEVNKNCDLNLVPEYLFTCANNVTVADRHHNFLIQQLNITSRNHSRLRREDMLILRDMDAIGFPDLPCCDKPVFKGSDHEDNTDVMRFEFVEFRFEFVFGELDGVHLWLTTPEFLAKEIVFFRVCMDGQNVVNGVQRSQVMEVHLREEDGIFILEDSLIFNFFHLPEGSFIRQREDTVIELVLPDGTVFINERAPEFDGLHIDFLPYRRVNQSPFVINPMAPTQGIRESFAIISGNEFRDLD